MMGELDHISRGLYSLDSRVRSFGAIERKVTSEEGTTTLTITPQFLYGMWRCMQTRRRDLGVCSLDVIAEEIINKNKDGNP